MTIKFTIPYTFKDHIYTLHEDGNVTWEHDGGGSEQVGRNFGTYYLGVGWWKEEEEEDVTDEVAETAGPTITDAQTGAITSDGRSSTYYDIDVPDWLIARVLERHEEGRAYIKTEELIEVAFHDDFDAGNAFKSLIRLWGAFNGAGKAGNSVSYEKNKIEYSVGKLEQRYERKEEATDW